MKYVVPMFLCGKWDFQRIGRGPLNSKRWKCPVPNSFYQKTLANQTNRQTNLHQNKFNFFPLTFWPFCILGGWMVGQNNTTLGKWPRAIGKTVWGTRKWKIRANKTRNNFELKTFPFAFWEAAWQAKWIHTQGNGKHIKGLCLWKRLFVHLNVGVVRSINAIEKFFH